VLRTRLVAAPSTPAHEPGRILAVTKDAVQVQAGDGPLELLIVQPEGRRAMPARDFATGHRLVPGARFDAAAAEARPSSDPKA